MSNDERDLLRLLSPTPGHPAPTDMSHYCLQNAARRVLDRAPEHPPASPPLPLPCPCIQDLPRPTRGPTPRHLASRLQPDKPRGYRFNARTVHHSHRRRHPLLQPHQHQLRQHRPHALPCRPKTSLSAHSAPSGTRPAAWFDKVTIVPKVTRRETVDVQTTPFFCFNSHTLLVSVSVVWSAPPLQCSWEC